jgi:hypothetical protein
MPSSSYYSKQGKLLLSWALATNDPERAAQLEARACELLALANCPDDPSAQNLEPLLDEFNKHQLRKS